jgi:hypothetical protein
MQAIAAGRCAIPLRRQVVDLDSRNSYDFLLEGQQRIDITIDLTVDGVPLANAREREDVSGRGGFPAHDVPPPLGVDGVFVGMGPVTGIFPNPGAPEFAGLVGAGPAEPFGGAAAARARVSFADGGRPSFITPGVVSTYPGYVANNPSLAEYPVPNPGEGRRSLVAWWTNDEIAEAFDQAVRDQLGPGRSETLRLGPNVSRRMRFVVSIFAPQADLVIDPRTGCQHLPEHARHVASIWCMYDTGCRVATFRFPRPAETQIETYVAHEKKPLYLFPFCSLSSKIGIMVGVFSDPVLCRKVPRLVIHCIHASFSEDPIGRQGRQPW